MAVGPDERVRICDFDAVLILVGPDGLRQIFKVHLVADAGAGGYNAEVVKRLLTPFQEGVAFDVALVFAVNVHLERARVAELVDHDRVVDDKINRVQRVNLVGIATQGNQPVAHRRKVDNCGNAGEILHQHACGTVSDLARVLAALGTPFGEGLDVIDGDSFAIFETQHVLKHHLKRGWQVREITQTGFLRCRNRILSDGLAARR